MKEYVAGKKTRGPTHILGSSPDPNIKGLLAGHLLFWALSWGSGPDQLTYKLPVNSQL